jgi:amidase
LEQAYKVDRLRESGKPLGRLHGIPLSVKECQSVKGTASSNGLASFGYRIMTEDSAVISTLREEGAIPFVKSFMTFGGAGLEAQNSI